MHHRGLPEEAGNNSGREKGRRDRLLSTQSSMSSIGLQLFYLTIPKRCQMKSVLKFSFVLEVDPTFSLSYFLSQENGILHHCALPV